MFDRVFRDLPNLGGDMSERASFLLVVRDCGDNEITSLSRMGERSHA